MSKNPHFNLDLAPKDWTRLVNLCGPRNGHIHQLEHALGVSIHNRGGLFSIRGGEQAGRLARKVLRSLYDMTKTCELTPDRVHLHLQQSNLDMLDGAPGDGGEAGDEALDDALDDEEFTLVKPRGRNQILYLKNMLRAGVSFGVGPAGTGKTYLAVARAVEALNDGLVKKLILVRPAVEAGEHLGFLPGDLSQKVDPYLRPLYDALCDFLSPERMNRLIADGVIEIAPLAYMRGRSLNRAFIILDEAQNTTRAQMKMFLTRLGFGSFAVVTGDTTQVDLMQPGLSGLEHALHILKDVDGVSFTFFSSRDVTRHALVKNIVDAYDRHEKRRDAGE